MARGKLIVFEGLDRSGKSTQCERLVSYLSERGVPVRHRRFPGKLFQLAVRPERGLIVLADRTTPIGQMINNYLQGQSEQEDHVIHLLFSANRWEAV